MKVFNISIFILRQTTVCSLLFLSGCSILADKPAEIIKKPEVFKVSSRKLPPEPVYNKVRSVHLPITTPSYIAPEAGPLELKKNLKISVKNVALEDVVKGLAATSKYSAYTASPIAKNKISLKSYGDLDQIAADLEQASKTNIFVDHENREIRVLEQHVNIENKAKFALAE